ncbi:MAG: fibronectin type III domain-containing protein [Bacteroidota bacterium]
MKKAVGMVVILSFCWEVFAQVDTSYVYNTNTGYGTLDIRIAKSATRYYYLQENKTISFRESSPGVKTNTYLDMTSWDSSPYTQGNLREKSGASDYFIMNYRLLFPNNYSTTYSPGYPIIVMMHGAGERGNCWDNNCYHADRKWKPLTNTPPAPTDADFELMNNDHNLLHGGKPHFDARNQAGTRLPNDPGLSPRAFPGFVLFAQNLNGWDIPTLQDAIKLVRLVVKKYNIDEDRVYIHGLSNGGIAVYEAIKRAPWLFAAALPMSAPSDAGITTQNQLVNTAHIPLWIFQGGQDLNPTPSKTESYIRKFRSGGAIVRYSLYPNLGHGTWNTAYKEPEFFSWMLSKNKAALHSHSGNTAICQTTGQGVRLELAKGFRAYQWERNGVIISGATAAVYEANTTGTYRARFSRVPNPSASEWNEWSAPVTVSQQNPPRPIVEQIGTLLLKDLNNYNNARLKAVGDFAHYYWYQNGTLVNLTGSEDDTTQYPIFKAGNCTGPCTGNGSYTLVTAGFDGCPSPPSLAKQIIFNNQAPVSITAPGDFTGQILSLTTVKLNWNDASSNETGFEIWRRKVLGSSSFSPWEMRTITNVNIETFTDDGLEPSSTYHYKIRAVSSSARSNYTPSASPSYLVINTADDNTAPSAPQNLSAATTAIQTIKLMWQASTDNTGIRQYRIYFNGQSIATGSTQTSHVLTDLDLNTSYTFTVKAEDLGGNLSAASNSATASTYVNGLYYEHSTGAWSDIDEINWSSLPEFTGTVPNFTLTPRTQEDYFNFEFDGFLYISIGGSYTFQTVSSDGSRLTLDGVLVVNNDGIHGTRTITSVSQNLSAGAKRINVKYFEYADNQVLTVRYKGPDTGNSWMVIPNVALTSGTSPTMLASGDEFASAREPAITEAPLALTVFPNPTSQHDINFKLITENVVPIQVRVIDFNGREVYHAEFDPSQHAESMRIIPQQLIPDGIYLMIVEQEGRITRQRVSIKN